MYKHDKLIWSLHVLTSLGLDPNNYINGTDLQINCVYSLNKYCFLNNVRKLFLVRDE